MKLENQTKPKEKTTENENEKQNSDYHQAHI